MGSIFRLELGWRHSEGQAVSPIKKAARHIIWQHFFFFFYLLLHGTDIATLRS